MLNALNQGTTQSLKMITNDQDPDVVRWGQQLFDCNPYPIDGFCSTVSPNDTSCYQGQYFNVDRCDMEGRAIENDELVARSLQDEFSQLAVVEAAGSSNEGGPHLQASNFPQEWFAHSMGSYSPEHKNHEAAADDSVPSSSCSSPEEEQFYGEDWSNSQDLTNEYALDGEMGRLLDQMVPVPHVPKINGEIPSVDEATLDYQRLLDRLQSFNLVEVQGDGNCQFRALSDQLYRSSEHHEFVRQEIVNQLKSHPENYEGYVPMAYGDYIEKMSMSGEWGDHVTLQAAADLYGVRIFVITSFKDTRDIEILPNVEKSKRVIFLSFWAEVHYNSIHPRGDAPVSETKKKKRRRLFRNKHVATPDELKQ